jgi:hypothetical protein
MRKVFAAFVCVLGALAIAGPAGAGVSVGVNDDAGKYSDGAPQFWQTMSQNGLRQNAITILWDETQPTTILDQSFIQHALPAAQAAGVKVVFDVYPMHSQAFTQNGAKYADFGAFLTKLANTFPSVTEYVVMNECNQKLFVNPQFNASGVNQSAAICGSALAAGYDALKAVNPSIFVWGVGLSPRGNDNPNAASNQSTSPVNFLKALGAWYKASGRAQPLMDGLDFHPYPVPQSLPFATGYADPDNAAVSNIGRIYQAFYDGFKGTPQKTIGQQAGGGLPVSLNEVGIQTDSTGKAGYTGTEVSATPEGGVRGDTATEKFQSDWYLQMLNYVACDPNIKVVNLFHLVDESALEGWQSGLYYVGYAAKPSATAVSAWIKQTSGNCTGASKPFTPSGVAVPTGGTTGGTTGGGTGATTSITTTGQLSALFGGQPLNLSGGTLTAILNNLGKGFDTALQNTNVTVGLYYIGGATTASARGLSSATVKPVASVKTVVKKGKKLKVALKVKKLKAGFYNLRFDLKAVKGKAKATVTTKSFYLLANGKLGK